MQVYAGRVPNKLLPYLTEAVYGDGALGRPNEEDLAELREYGKKIFKKI